MRFQSMHQEWQLFRLCGSTNYQAFAQNTADVKGP